MTKRRLPETDLANIATLPRSEQKARLKLKRAFKPPYSLAAVRRNEGMLLGVEERLDLGVPRPEDSVLLEKLASKLPDPSERAANLRRAKALIHLRKSLVQHASEENFRSYPLSLDSYIKLTDPLLLVIGSVAHIPSSDFRKSGRLTTRGRDFYFAMNYHLIIDADVDYRTAGLVLLDYWEEDNSNFGISPYFFGGRPRYSFEELSDMIKFTIDLWDEVLEEAKKAGSDEEESSDLPLFGWKSGKA